MVFLILGLYALSYFLAGKYTKKILLEYFEEDVLDPVDNVAITFFFAPLWPLVLPMLLVITGHIPTIRW